MQARQDLALIKAQNRAGFDMKDLGLQLRGELFEASALGGKAKVAFDGLQRLRSVEVEAGALEAAGGDSAALAQALLGALQEAHDNSYDGSQERVWGLYEQNSVLIQAPLSQLGAGNTAEDLWANVTRNEETEKLAAELFERFDQDRDGYWNLKETSQIQMATEGSEMAEEAFNSLVLAAAPNGGRNLTEEQLGRGLSREQVIELYTDAKRQRQLGFVLDVYKDHALVFSQDQAAADAAAAASAPAPVAPSVD